MWATFPSMVRHSRASKNNVPNNLQVLGKHYYPHFVNEETDVHGSWVTCLQTAELWLLPPNPKAFSWTTASGPWAALSPQLHHYLPWCHIHPEINFAWSTLSKPSGSLIGLNSILLRACDQKTCAIQFFPHMPLLSWPITGGLCSVVCLRPIIISPL